MSETKLGGRFTFPGTSLTVRRMGYGAMQLAGPHVFGPPKDPDEAVAVLREAIESGVDHIDTSDFYGPHVTNQIIRRALHPYPEGLVIVTKLGAVRGEDASWRPAHGKDDLVAGVHDNLRNLGLDALDVVNLRVGGMLEPIEGSIADKVEVLADLQHQGLIRAQADGFQKRGDEVETAVRVEPHVEHRRRRAAHGYGGEPQAPNGRRWARALVLGRYGHGRPAKRVAGILIDGRLDAPRNHQTQMNAIGHGVGRQDALEGSGHFGAGHADVEADGFSALEQPIEMDVQEKQAAFVQPKTLPHAIAHAKAGVEDRHPGLGTRHKLAIEPYARRLVARIGVEVLTACQTGLPI